MRTLWNAVSFLAVVNLLALLILAGWLWRSDRVDGGRLRQIRAMLAETVGDEQARLAAAEAESAAAASEASAAERAQNPPLPGAVHAGLRAHLRDVEHEAARRIDAESRRLRDELDGRARELAPILNGAAPPAPPAA